MRIVITDDKGQVQQVNPAFTLMTGYGAPEVIGQNISMLKSGLQSPEFYERLWSTIRGGRIWRGDLVNRRKDGTLYSEAMTINPVRDSTGAIRTYVAIKQDVAALRAAEEAQRFLASIVEASEDAIFTATPEGAIKSWNPGAESLYGYQAGEVVGKPLDMLVPPQRVRAFRERVFDGVMRGERVLPYAVQGLRKDGALVDILVSAYPIRNAAGRVMAGAFTERDLTAFKKAENATALLASIVEHARDAIFCSALDGTILSWNRGAEALYGYSAAEITGNNVSVLAPPERFKEQAEALIRVQQGGEISQVETHAVKADGSRVEISVTVSPVRNAAGEVVGCSTIAHDIGRRKRDEEALRRSEDKYRSLVANLPDVVWTADQEGHLVFASGGGQRARAFISEQLERHGIAKLIHPEDAAMVRKAHEGLFANRQPLDVEFRLKEKDGAWAWIHNRSIASYEKDGKWYADGIATDLTERKRMEETLAHHATHDPLTDLPNRAICDNVLQLALARARRRGGLVALLHLDLDRFRVINDTLGHEVGDMLLRQVAMRLAGSLRESEVPSRTGGDKFVVVLSELDDPEAAAGVAQRVIDALSAPYDLRGTEVFVGVSVGVALFPRDGSDVSTLQKSADSAMLAAKKQGKNRVQMFTADMHTAASERLALESELHRALERNELLVHYQPLFDLATARIVGAEALLRWESPKFGRVPPSVFIPIAEESGLIVPIGGWVLRQACWEVRSWREAGHGAVQVAVNVSVCQFTHGNLAGMVAQALADAGVDGSCLIVEVTESVIMQNATDSAQQLTALRKLGVRVSLDDFGTGYSSLSHLEDLPINDLKIDRSFVQRLNGIGNAGTLVQAIGALAHSLGMRTVAEGVENQHQLDLLKAMRCDLAQGYFLARPDSPGRLRERLAGQALVSPVVALAGSPLLTVQREPGTIQ
jgi:diguanylate cyclase (GGDEF)-like protein/PAS domain S-box-containing protein